MTSQFSIKEVLLPTGLTNDEARRRYVEFGPNEVSETITSPIRRVLTKLWAPVPWMLEAAIILELVLGKLAEAIIISVLLIFNASLAYSQGSADSSNASSA